MKLRLPSLKFNAFACYCSTAKQTTVKPLSTTASVATPKEQRQQQIPSTSTTHNQQLGLRAHHTC